MTRKEAEADAKELNKRDPQWFCPLINGPCNKNCVNFMPAFVVATEKKKSVMLHDAKDDDFLVDGFSCTNAMFTGPTL
jgi:hypothetical protein